MTPIHPEPIVPSDPTLVGLSAAELRHDLLDARARTLDLIDGLDDAQLMGPRLPIVNPLHWEIGHLAWFHETWILRHWAGRDSLRADADRLYDSMNVPHDARWDLPLPTLAETLDYMKGVEDRVLDLLAGDPVEPRLAYFVRLVTFHEDMHGEAFTYTRQTLGYPAPALRIEGREAVRETHPVDAGEDDREPRHGIGEVGDQGVRTVDHGDVEIPGGPFELGAPSGAEPFVFDNEKWAHPVEVRPFAISRTAVSNGAFAAFVEDSGYARRDLWSEEGWAWRESARAEHPVAWRRRGPGGWERREFDRWLSLDGDLALIHVNAHEADAYCRWAGRRLPTEAEWEMAACEGAGPKPRFAWGSAEATRDRANLDGERLGVVATHALPIGDSPRGCRQLVGNVWEWTATPFAPYPGFVPDPYRDYSLPWFDGRHAVLRGGAWATRSRLLRNTWRNFYPRDRRDVFAGFRTCRVG